MLSPQVCSSTQSRILVSTFSSALVPWEEMIRPCRHMYAGIVVMLAASAVATGEMVEEESFKECSSHCGSEHAAEHDDKNFCVELCRLFDFPEPATLE